MKHFFFVITTLIFTCSVHAEQQYRGYLGIAVDKVPASVKAHFPDEVADSQGLIITRLADISPAADDGIKLYDILIAYDNEPVKEPEKLLAKIANETAGRVAKLKVIRQGKVLPIPVTIGKHKWQAVTQSTTPQQIPRRFQQHPAQAVIPRFNPPPMMQPIPNPVAPKRPLNIAGKPMFPMQKQREKHAWGDERHIWPDFYTDGTNSLWDNMVNAPFKMGRMPGGWRAPSLSMPDPVTIGDAVTNQIPPIIEEAGNMTDFSD